MPPATYSRVVVSLLLVVLLLGATDAVQAQAVPQVVLVEHFTNTRCSVCFNRNPGFYQNLAQQPAGTLHIAYHPSSPYQACVFSQQNRPENDARTNFYGIYGSTPRLVINGSVIPAAQNYGSAAVFAPFQSQTAALAVSVAFTQPSADSVAATVQVRTVAGATFTAPTLWVALVEDTVFYAAPNGENLHRDVFRRSFTGVAPVAIVPAALGGTLTVRRAVRTDAAWALPRLYAIALVQQTGGALVQAGASVRLGTPTLGLTPTPTLGAAPALYPNPATATVRFATEPGAPWHLTDVLGRELMRGVAAGASAGSVAETVTIDTKVLAPGTYVVRVGGRRAARFSKE